MSTTEEAAAPPPPTAAASPTVRFRDPQIEMAHGAGGKASRRLVEGLLVPLFGGPAGGLRGPLADAATLEVDGARLAFTADSFVVRPLRFPGGSIGELAVHGTVNDLAVSAAQPLALLVTLVLEEGLPASVLEEEARAIARAAERAGVQVVGGDTKVVERGKADGMYVTTAGIGRLDPRARCSPRAVRPGDRVLLSGPIGDHGITILLARGDLELEAELSSDTRSVYPLVASLLDAAAPGLRWMRDPTRGGVATALNELARDCGLGIALAEEEIPVRDAVRGSCEILGLDPLHIANEGQFLAVVAPEYAGAALEALQKTPGGEEAAIVGEVREAPVRTVLGVAAYGGTRVIDMLAGDPLPPDLLDMEALATDRAAFVAERFALRNRISAGFFPQESERLAHACQAMAERFLRGGRLLAFGRRHYATDAQHVAVEFVHPVIVGKRALPALDLSLAGGRGIAAIVRPNDMVMGFGPPEGDPEMEEVFREVRKRGAQTFAFPAPPGDAEGPEDYAFSPPTSDPYLHQELVEIVYHTLWETVHVFFEHREMGHDVGASGFLYPFLGQEKQDTSGLISQVAASIVAKSREDEQLRAEVATGQAEGIARAAAAIAERLGEGGQLLLFGNGGSATDANDWALDCTVPLKSFRPIPAVSLAHEPAVLSALANDIGPEAIFLRQLIAQAKDKDVAVAISTSGGSANVLAALVEAKKRGLLTVALLGYDGGETVRRGLADHPLVVPCDYVPRIQEIQASTYHILLELQETAS